MKSNQTTADLPRRVVPTFSEASNADYLLMLLWFVPMFLWILWVNYLFTDSIDMPWWFPPLGTVLFAPFVYRRYQTIKRIFALGIYSEGTFTCINLGWYSTSVRYTYQGKVYLCNRWVSKMPKHLKQKNGELVPIVFDPKHPERAYLVSLFDSADKQKH